MFILGLAYNVCVILVNVLVNSKKFPIFCDTLYMASVAEKWLP